MARSIDVPVISVSRGHGRHRRLRRRRRSTPLEAIPRLLNRANQALQTLERYKSRLDDVSSALSALEVEDLVTLRDVVAVLQRTEMVRRIAEEIEGYIVELGVDGRLDPAAARRAHGRRRGRPPLRAPGLLRRGAAGRSTTAIAPLATLTTDELLDLQAVAAAAPPAEGGADLDASLQPRGYRLLAKIPRLPEGVIGHIVDRFGSLQKIMRATIDDLDEVEGVGGTRARAIKEGLSRLTETSILDRYS